MGKPEKPADPTGTTRPGDELRRTIADPGYTPGLKHLSALLALLGGDEDEARAAARAVLRIEARQREAVARGVQEAAERAAHPARSRLTRLLGDLAREGAGGRAWLVGALRDADPKTRRAAARALSKLPGDAETEAALLAAWDAAEKPEDQAPIAEALAATGSAAAGDRLRRAAQKDPRMARASLVHERERTRSGATQRVRTDVRLPHPLTLRFHVRRGLEPIVVEEIPSTWRPRTAFHATVEAETDEPLARALAVRTALDVGLLVGAQGTPAGDVAGEVARVLSSKAVLDLLARLTEHDGAIRYRVAFARGGHRRAEVWRIAELVRAATDQLVNDPTRTTWEAVVHEHRGEVQVELVPKAFEDARVAWRTETVAASSHPTIAAAIARVAPRRDDDVVWDPFVGAGAELVERGLLGPAARLVGTDIEERALAAARGNLERAGLVAELTRADATTFDPGGPTLIVSNPPMGRRVQRGSHGSLLERFVAHAARTLRPGGALVWIVPEPERVHAAAAASGFTAERTFRVDMGGFPAELMLLRLGSPAR